MTATIVDPRGGSVTAECPCGGKGWMWCPECRRVDAGRLHTGIAKNCRNHRPVPTCPTCLPDAAADLLATATEGRRMIRTPQAIARDDGLIVDAGQGFE